MENRFVNAFVDKAFKLSDQHRELQEYRKRAQYKLIKCDTCGVFGPRKHTCMRCGKFKLNECAGEILNQIYGNGTWTENLYDSVYTNICNSPICAHCYEF